MRSLLWASATDWLSQLSKQSWGGGVHLIGHKNGQIAMFDLSFVVPSPYVNTLIHPDCVTQK